MLPPSAWACSYRLFPSLLYQGAITALAGVGLSGVDADIIREILASKHKPNSRRDFSFAAMTQPRIAILGEARRKAGFAIS